MDETILQDQQIQVVEKKTPSIIAEATTIVINSELTSKHANDLLSACKKLFNIAEDRRKFFVKPLQDHVKNINEQFKKMTIPLEEAERILKEKLLGYIKELQKKEAEADRLRQEKEREANKEKQATINDFLGPEEKQVIIEEKPIVVDDKPKVTIDSGLGKSYTRKVWKWKVIDEGKIPRDYFRLDEKMIDTLLKAHTKTIKGVSVNELVIPGIEVYQDVELSTRGG